MMTLKTCERIHKRISPWQRGSLMSQAANELDYKKRIDSKISDSFLSHNVSKRFISLSYRNLSVESPDSTSSPEQEPSEFDRVNRKSLFSKLLKSRREVGTKNSTLSEENKDFLEKSSPRLSKERIKTACLQKFVKSFPNDIDPNLLLDAFAKKVGFKHPNLITCTHLIHTFALSGDYSRAQSIFDLMVSKGIQPNEKAYCALMNAYSNGGELAKTIELFELARNDLESKDHYPYTILIKAYLMHKRVQDAFGVLLKMKQKMSPGLEIYNSILQQYVETNNTNCAQIIHGMMCEDGCLPDLSTYTMLITISLKRNVRRSLELFEELLNRGLSPDYKLIISLLMALCTKPGYYLKAIELLHTLTTKKVLSPNAFILVVMIRGAAANRSLIEARRFFYQLQQMECDSKSRLYSFSAMFEAYAASFAVDQDERFLGSSHSEVHPDFSFLKSPYPRCIEDCVKEAMKLIPFLERIPVTKDSIHSNSRVWVFFLSILTNYNYFKDSIIWFEIISEKLQNHLHSQFFSCMLNMCIRLNEEESFFVILESAKALVAPVGAKSSLTEREKMDYKRANSLSPIALEGLYRSFISGLSKFGRLSEALYYFELIAQDSTMNWKNDRKYYQLFIKAINNADDPDLKLRLHRVL